DYRRRCRIWPSAFGDPGGVLAPVGAGMPAEMTVQKFTSRTAGQALIRIVEGWGPPNRYRAVGLAKHKEANSAQRGAPVCTTTWPDPSRLVGTYLANPLIPLYGSPTIRSLAQPGHARRP